MNCYQRRNIQFNDIDWSAIIAQAITEGGKYAASRRQNQTSSSPPSGEGYTTGFQTSQTDLFWRQYGMYIIIGGFGLLAIMMIK